ncbi:hypothetical protein G6F60_014374 [Rhizopus arrhizus]|nr:hypothetical protein G6F60_014374 [Rhizopus arrhizus]
MLDGLSPALRACAAGPRDERAVQEQAVVGTERDAAAVAVQLQGAHPVHVHGRSRTGRVQHRARPDDDVSVGGRRRGAVMIDFTADHDDATRVRHAIAAALRVHAGFRAAGHVQHRLLTNPDRPVVHLARGGLDGLCHIDVAHAQLADIDLAASRLGSTAPGPH